MSKRDFYDVLGVQKGASDADLKKAYRRLARDLHPDKNKDDPKAAEKFKEVNEAYDVLKDAEKKAAYDQFGHAAFEGGMGGGGRGGAGGPEFSSAFSDVFDDLFGDFMGGQRRGGGGGRARTRGSDLRYNLKINLEDAFTGKETTISVPGSVACDSCDGTGGEGGPGGPPRCHPPGRRPAGVTRCVVSG